MATINATLNEGTGGLAAGLFIAIKVNSYFSKIETRNPWEIFLVW
jgi:hypothetical protein